MANLGIPTGQAPGQSQGNLQGQPDWFQDFAMQSGPQQGQAGYYADQYTDIANQYSGQLGQLGQQYGQEALYNPAFLQAGRNDFSTFNPFTAQAESGNVGGVDWSWDPFGGMSGLNEGIQGMEHYMKHGQDVMRNAGAGRSQGDRDFLEQWGMDWSTQGLDMSRGDRIRDAYGNAQAGYQDMLNLQQQYGGY